MENTIYDRDSFMPYAVWTHDCQGKQDFDGRLFSISTRYYPGAGNPEHGFMVVDNGPGGAKITIKPYGKHPSAIASILLNVGPKQEHDGGGEYVVLVERHFTAPTEAEVKDQVEGWVRDRCQKIATVVFANRDML